MSAKADKTDKNKKLMLAALEKSLGIVSPASKACNVSRDTHYRWLKEDLDYKQSVESIKNATLDFAESQLHKQIRQGNTTAIIFFLKTQAKSRGYIEKTVHDLNHFEQPFFPDDK